MTEVILTTPAGERHTTVDAFLVEYGHAIPENMQNEIRRYASSGYPIHGDGDLGEWKVRGITPHVRNFWDALNKCLWVQGQPPASYEAMRAAMDAAMAAATKR